jgi:Protein of unknown function (DUF3619)
VNTTVIEKRLEAAEARVARRIAAGLEQSAAALPVARELALQRARPLRLAERVASAVAGGGGSAVLGGDVSGGGWWWRLASAGPILLLVAGLLLIEQINDAQQIEAAAEIDAILLADDLPPQAYSDPGFGEFLRRPAD